MPGLDGEVVSTSSNTKFKKIIHQVSDPVQTIAEGRKLCNKMELWLLASMVTPFLNFYMGMHLPEPSEDRCIQLLMYHWWS